VKKTVDGIRYCPSFVASLKAGVGRRRGNIMWKRLFAAHETTMRH